ncbi:MAG: SUMF1/EgtB/PvdO family nonheme iron enzyme, partial [bacterium]|nr:SUMF1/EgtB/PvdO family nonheme iron enzyme [bacterium]
MSQIALESPPALRTINDQIDPQLETIVLKSLEKQPSDRWDSMLAFAEALEAWRPSNAPSKEPPTTKRRWPLIAAGLLGVIGLVWAAAVLIKIDTEAGTIVLEIDDPSAIGAVVTVDGKTIKINQQGQLPIQVTADEKEQMLKVTKGGFETFTEKFSVKSGGKESIRVRLVAAAKTQPPEKTGWHGWPADAPAPAIAPFDAKQAKQHQQAWADYLKVPVETTNTIGMKFVLIPPGEFLMGSTPEEIKEDLQLVGGDAYRPDFIKSAAPRHKVILSQAIYLGVNEVTQAEYAKVIGTNPSHFASTGSGKDTVAKLDTTNHPVESVSWIDAVAFCTKLSQKEELEPFYRWTGETITPLDGTGYRLPTEAEWEFACRAGTTTRYWIGDQDHQLVRADWYGTNRTHTVGELKKNMLGLSDMHGNVGEWVEDTWQPTFYSEFANSSAIDPIAPSMPYAPRVSRGGNWRGAIIRCRSSDRHAGSPTGSSSTIGFRVAMPVVSSRGDRSAGIDKPQAKPEQPKPPALPKDIELVAEPVEHKPNEPLSLLALVRDPAPLEGALSWSLQTRHHRTPVNCVQFSPDGSLMATGGSDGTIRLWDYPSNQLKQIISTKNAIGELVFSPGGRYFASVGSRGTAYGSYDPHAEIRETATGRLVKRFSQNVIYWRKPVIAWHPQGERFATIDNADILIWNLQSGFKAKTLKGHSNHIVDIAWSADGDWLATASESEVILWDTS